MKKTIVKVLVLSLVSIMMCMALVSCGGPNADPAKALAALKENDYVAEKVDNDGLGAIALAFLDVAGIDDVECVVSGTNDDGEHITIFYFEDKEAADAEWEDVEKYVDSEKEKDEEETKWVLKKSDRMIYFGTKNAVKAAQ